MLFFKKWQFLTINAGINQRHFMQWIIISTMCHEFKCERVLNNKVRLTLVILDNFMCTVANKTSRFIRFMINNSIAYGKFEFIDKDRNKILDTKSVFFLYILFLSIFGNFLERSVTSVPHYRWSLSQNFDTM
jgi:hypothetical protein